MPEIPIRDRRGRKIGYIGTDRSWIIPLVIAIIIGGIVLVTGRYWEIAQPVIVGLFVFSALWHIVRGNFQTAIPPLIFAAIFFYPMVLLWIFVFLFIGTDPITQYLMNSFGDPTNIILVYMLQRLKVGIYL